MGRKNLSIDVFFPYGLNKNRKKPVQKTKAEIEFFCSNLCLPEEIVFFSTIAGQRLTR